jgi:hypothetical protein
MRRLWRAVRDLLRGLFGFPLRDTGRGQDVARELEKRHGGPHCC